MEENEVNNDNNNENNTRNNFEENAEAIINEVVEYDHPDQVYYFERRLTQPETDTSGLYSQLWPWPAGHHAHESHVNCLHCWQCGH